MFRLDHIGGGGPKPSTFHLATLSCVVIWVSSSRPDPGCEKSDPFRSPGGQTAVMGRDDVSRSFATIERVELSAPPVSTGRAGRALVAPYKASDRPDPVIRRIILRFPMWSSLRW